MIIDRLWFIIHYCRLKTISDCEPVDLTEYESQQQQLVENAVEKWLQS